MCGGAALDRRRSIHAMGCASRCLYTKRCKWDARGQRCAGRRVGQTRGDRQGGDDARAGAHGAGDAERDSASRAIAHLLDVSATRSAGTRVTRLSVREGARMLHGCADLPKAAGTMRARGERRGRRRT